MAKLPIKIGWRSLTVKYIAKKSYILCSDVALLIIFGRKIIPKHSIHLEKSFNNILSRKLNKDKDY
jgi:hypothetical protein